MLGELPQMVEKPMSHESWLDCHLHEVWTHGRASAIPRTVSCECRSILMVRVSTRPPGQDAFGLLYTALGD